MVEVHRLESDALARAIHAAGSQSALARLLQCTPTTVWKMVKAGRMSQPYVLAAERLTGISRYDLRPDIYPIDDSHPAAPTVPGAPPAPSVPAGGAVSRNRTMEGARP